jgi:hypothetical protein
MTETQLLVVPRSIPIIFPMILMNLMFPYGSQSLCHRAKDEKMADSTEGRMAEGQS